jgi:hypothetical protein
MLVRDVPDIGDEIEEALLRELQSSQRIAPVPIVSSGNEH